MCDHIIAAHRNDSEVAVREQVASSMVQKAELQLRRHQQRAALRTLAEVGTYCGDPPAEALKRWADRSRTRAAAVRARSADRWRLRLVAFALLVALNAPTIKMGLGVVRQRTNRPRRRT